jgi:hypothetical protein
VDAIAFAVHAALGDNMKHLEFDLSRTLNYGTAILVVDVYIFAV